MTRAEYDVVRLRRRVDELSALLRRPDAESGPWWRLVDTTLRAIRGVVATPTGLVSPDLLRDDFAVWLERVNSEADVQAGFRVAQQRADERL